MMNKRKFRLMMLGILCGGLLLAGVGAGVGFSEAATFTYAGETLLEQAEPQAQQLTVHLRGDGGQIFVNSYVPGLDIQLGDMARIVVSEDVQPNTMELDLRYDSVGMDMYTWNDHGEGKGADQEVHLSWAHGSNLELLLACKDQLLADLKDHQIGDYIPARLTDMVITVNPADAARVSIG